MVNNEANSFNDLTLLYTPPPSNLKLKILELLLVIESGEQFL